MSVSSVGLKVTCPSPSDDLGLVERDRGAVLRRRRADRELADEVVAQVDADRRVRRHDRALLGAEVLHLLGLRLLRSAGSTCRRCRSRSRSSTAIAKRVPPTIATRPGCRNSGGLLAAGSAAGPSGFAGRSGTDRHGIAAPARLAPSRAVAAPVRARGRWHVCSGAADPDNPAGTLVGMAGSTVADLVGRVLAGRYRLLGAIGSGASGRVYVADDVRLRRRVAVKVLARRARGRLRLPASLPLRGAARGVAAPPERDGGLRLGRGRRAVHGARAARGRLAAQHARRREPAVARAGRARRRSGRRRARLRARPRAGAPRHQAREPALRRARHRARRRLRARRARSPRRAGPSPPARSSAPRATPRPSRASGAPLDGRVRPLRARARDGGVGHRLRAARRRHAARHDRVAPGARDHRRSRARRARAGPRPRVQRRSRRRGTRRADAMRDRDRRGGRAHAAARARSCSPGLGAVGEDPHPTQVVRPGPRAVAVRPGPARGPRRPPTRPASVARVAAQLPVGRAVPARRRDHRADRGGGVRAGPAERRADDDRPAARRPVALERPEQTALDSNLLVDWTYRKSRRPSGHGDRPGPGARWLPRRADVGPPRPVEGPDAGAAPRARGARPRTPRRRRSRRSSRCRSSTNVRQDRAEGDASSARSRPVRAAPDSTVQLVVSTGPPLVVVPEVSGRSYDAAVARLARAAGSSVDARRRLQRHGSGRTASSAPIPRRVRRRRRARRSRCTSARAPTSWSSPTSRAGPSRSRPTLSAAAGVEIQASRRHREGSPGAGPGPAGRAARSSAAR